MSTDPPVFRVELLFSLKESNGWELTVAERDRIAEFKEVAERMPDDPVVRFGLAGAYLEAGQAESASVEYHDGRIYALDAGS